MTVATCSSGNSAKGCMRTWPALLTTTSSEPNASSAVATMASPPSTVAMVSWLATASPPAATIAATTSSAGFTAGASPEPSVSLMATPRSFTTTRAPREASCRAYSRPRPRPAPVMIATLPSKRSSPMTRV